MTPEEIHAKIDHIEGWFDLGNIEAFSSLELPDNPTIFECGTYKGRSTNVMALLWPGAEIYTCDPKDEDAILPKQALFYQDRGVDVAWDLPIDLLFIDDSHYYDDVKANFEKYEPWVRSGGYVVFHDVCFETDDVEGVRRFVRELGNCTIDSRGAYGVAIWRKP